MPLLGEVVFPVCAPSLLNTGAPLRSPAELAKYALIECDGAEAEDREFGWSTWLPRLGLDAVPPPRRLHFSQFGPALSAAVDGLGIALGRSPMVDTELAAGRLVRPLPKRVAAKASQVFALTWRDAGAVRNDQRIAAFRDFALDEACGCELAAGPCGMPPSERDFQMRAVWMGGGATRRTMTPATARDQGSA